MCEVIRNEDGTRTIVCRRAPHAKQLRCVTCKAPATLLCDGAVEERVVNRTTGEASLTCDKPMCARHAVAVGGDWHLCNGCAERARMKGAK